MAIALKDICVSLPCGHTTSYTDANKPCQECAKLQASGLPTIDLGGAKLFDESDKVILELFATFTKNNLNAEPRLYRDSAGKIRLELYDRKKGLRLNIDERQSHTLYNELKEHANDLYIPLAKRGKSVIKAILGANSYRAKYIDEFGRLRSKFRVLLAKPIIRYIAGVIVVLGGSVTGSVVF
jgi:hypothetical protein